ncbi:MAG: hypothetical protein NTX29_01040 [Actinobacteria bacterium]|nr:hypothetical protein [Actinomycetota bacterium]
MSADRENGFQPRVLVVEDDSFTRALIGESLAVSGMIVRSADSVAAAMGVCPRFG